MKAWIAWGTIVAAVMFGEAVSTWAQAPAGARPPAQAAPARPQQAAPAAPGATAPPPALALPPAGERRDPFRPIEIKGPAKDLAPLCTQAGKQGLLIGQLMLQGIARTVNGEWVAVVDNKTGRAYFLRSKDELCNGVVLRVEQESLVMEERTTDSFGRTRTREVVLRVPEA